MREKGAGMTRWIAEWSVKWEGEGNIEQEEGGRVRGEGGVVSQWSRQPPLRGKVGMGLWRGWRWDLSREVRAGCHVPVVVVDWKSPPQRVRCCGWSSARRRPHAATSAYRRVSWGV